MYVAYLWNRETGELKRVHSPEARTRYISKGWKSITFETYKGMGGK